MIGHNPPLERTAARRDAQGARPPRALNGITFQQLDAGVLKKSAAF